MSTETAIPDPILELAIVRISADDFELAAKVDARIKELLAIASAAKLLANHVFKSVNVGPMSKDPSREATYWMNLRGALESFYGPPASIDKGER